MQRTFSRQIGQFFVEDSPRHSYDTHGLENFIEGHKFFVAQITLSRSIRIDENVRRFGSLQNSVEKLLELLEKQGPGLHALLTRLTLREDVAEDLMQELFIKLAGSNRLSRVENLGAYMRTTAINLAFDWRRKESRLKTCSDEFIDAASDEKGALTRLIDTEQLRVVLDAADQLNDLQRRVFVMRHIEQNSFEQVAQEVGKTPHHVRALASRALARVRDICSKVQIRTTSEGGN
jgi:RNA polymerase sigma factor (sigma-70 family)